MYADDKGRACESDVREGDSVLLKPERSDKLTPTFRSQPFLVLDKTRNSVLVESPDGVQYKKNSAHVKKLVCRPNASQSLTGSSDSVTNDLPVTTD